MAMPSSSSSADPHNHHPSSSRPSLASPPPTSPSPSASASPSPSPSPPVYIAQPLPKHLQPPHMAKIQDPSIPPPPQGILYPVASSGRGFIPKTLRPQPTDQLVTVANPAGFPPRSLAAFSNQVRPFGFPPADPQAQPIHVMRPPSVQPSHLGSRQMGGSVSGGPIKSIPVVVHSKTNKSTEVGLSGGQDNTASEVRMLGKQGISQRTLSQRMRREKEREKMDANNPYVITTYPNRRKISQRARRERERVVSSSTATPIQLGESQGEPNSPNVITTYSNRRKISQRARREREKVVSSSMATPIQLGESQGEPKRIKLTQYVSQSPTTGIIPERSNQMDICQAETTPLPIDIMTRTLGENISVRHEFPLRSQNMEEEILAVEVGELTSIVSVASTSIQAPTQLGESQGEPLRRKPTVASFPSSASDFNGYKDLRDISRDDTVVPINDRKVRLTDGASLYALCRSWVRNGLPQERQPQFGEGVKILPSPLPTAVADTQMPKKNEGGDEDEEKEEDLGSVEHLSTDDMLQRHIKRAKRVRARLREERLQRIERYKQRLALLLPTPIDQFRTDAEAGS